MSRPDEGLIHQWLDGECTPEESARLEQLVVTDPEWAAAVAEARGLIAASSRIAGALDAVPHALPSESLAGPTRAGGTSTRSAQPRRAPIRTTPWMGLAAALVLVAGTSYVLRERSRAPFGVVSTPAPAPAPMDTAPGVQIVRDSRMIVPPPDVPSIGPARVAELAPELGGGRDAAGGTVASATPAVPPSAPPLVAAKEAPNNAQRAEADAETRRAVAMAAEGSRRASARPAAAAAAAREISPAPGMPTLDGCWRVTAPPALVGLLTSPVIRRAAGDTLVLLTVEGDITVVRAGDVLRGELVAVRVPCGQHDQR